MKNEIIIYQPDNLTKVEVKLENETVWLTLNQLAQLFGRDKSVISRHLKNIYKDGELVLEATVAKHATVQIEAGRQVKREIDYYNLDAIISVGYRVNSKQGVLFSKKNRNINCAIFTKNISKQLKQDTEKFNQQYGKLILYQFDKAHDRFLILDNQDVYHIPA